MEEIIFTYLVQKGGIFGVLLAISLFWIMFRERMFLFGSSKQKEETVDKNVELEKMLYKNLQNGLDGLNLKAEALDDKVSDVEKKIQDLWDWHNVKDSEGVPRWYVRKSLEESINKLEASIHELKDQMQENLKHIDTISKSRDDLSDKLDKSSDNRIAELKEIIENYNKTMNDLSFALEKIKYALKVNNGV
jgi:peptidoglycan hydrolase CwlO-like protein